MFYTVYRFVFIQCYFCPFRHANYFTLSRIPIHYTVMFKFYKNNLLSLHHLTAEDVGEKGENKLDVFII